MRPSLPYSVVDLGVFSGYVAEYAAATVRVGVVDITIMSVYVRRNPLVGNATELVRVG